MTNVESYLRSFNLTSLQHIPRAQNQEANRLAQNASGYRVFQEILSSETLANDWRVKITDYLKNPSQKVTRKLRYKSTKYVLLDDQLYYKTVNGVLLKCLSQEEARVLMGEVYEGICGAHQSTNNIRRLFLDITRGVGIISVLVMFRNRLHQL